MPGTIDAAKLQINKAQIKAVLEEMRNAQPARRRQITRLPQVPEGEFINRRNRQRQFRAYSTHLFQNLQEEIPEMDGAFALFDEGGCMLQLKCTDAVRRWLASRGIVRGTMWTLETAGVNAVTAGLAGGQALWSEGTENEAPFLQDMALYFSPVKYNDGTEMVNFGGTAILVPKEKANTAFMLMNSSIAVSLSIRIRTTWNISEAYEVDERGLGQLDINAVTGAAYLVQHNEKFFDMLGAPRRSRRNSYFVPLEDLVDPLPQNKKFWEIVNGLKTVASQEITLLCGGRRINLILTTRNNSNEFLRTCSLIMALTTRSQISSQVADKTGNNAIFRFEDIIGQSVVMKSAVRRGRLLSNTESNIMLLGESGVGKDVFAQAIHNQSSRANGPFVSVNCGALPRELIASELFGYDSGAFTGAKKNGNIGKFELANGGTLFLDEIGEMPLELQATLLRAVEQKQFMRLGSTKTVQVDVKIIAATNVDLNQKIREKKFRADLYYRLSTMTLRIPPLREREDDVLLLTRSFLKKYAPAGTMPKVLSPEVSDFLRHCRFDGNVRELQNLCECLAQLYTEDVVTLQMIRESINPVYFAGNNGYYVGNGGYAAGNGGYPVGNNGYSAGNGGYPAGNNGLFAGNNGNGMPERLPRENAIDAGERLFLSKEEIFTALEACGGNRRKAAEYLGVGRRTLYRYIEKYEIENKFKKD